MSIRETGPWGVAYAELHERIVADPQFREVVRCYGGRPEGSVPSRRCRRVAVRMCARLGLNPVVNLGNVYGAAADAIKQGTFTPVV